MGRRAAVTMNGARTPVVLAAIAVAIGIAACDRSPDRSSAVKPELTPTAPAIAPPPANPAPVMPPKAASVLETPPQTTAAGLPTEAAEKQAPAAPTGSDAKAKEPMTKEEESTAMPKPAQANDHSTTATDGKR